MIAWDQIGLTTVFLTSDIEVAAEDTNADEVSVEKEVDAEAEENAEADMTEGEEAEENAEASSEESVTEEEEASEDGETGNGEVVEGEESVDGMEEGDMGGMMNEEIQTPKDPLLSNPIAFGGISVGVFVVGGIIGLLLAKKKIKKGIELYEDI